MSRAIPLPNLTTSSENRSNYMLSTMDKAPLHQEKAILDDHYAIRPTTVVAPEGPWGDVRKDIEELYLVQNLSLPEVMEEMENRGFTAT